MSDVRLVLESPCEHGGMMSHQMPGVDVLTYGDVRCPGGSRRVVTVDYEAAQSLLDTVIDNLLPAGQNLVIDVVHIVNAALGLEDM